MTNSDHEKHLQESRVFWDKEAANFDNEPDHGLRDPITRAAWTELLRAHLPHPPSTVLDIGCGTGSLSVVLAILGHTVTGIDLSPEMITRARAKAARVGYPIQFHVMDAAYPQLPPQQFDAIVCRHLLWALPEPKEVLQRWAELLKPGGMLFLVEGFWHTGAGLHMEDVVESLPATFTNISTLNLSSQSNLWGGPVTDERYAVIARLTI